MPKASESKSNEINDLIHALDASTGWVHQLATLNDALAPFRNASASIDALQKDLASLEQQKAALAHEIAGREQYLASVNERITIEDDARKQHIDADLADYMRSVDSRKRSADEALADVLKRTTDLAAAFTSKQQLINDLTDQIEDQRRILSDIQSKVAASVRDALAAAGGHAHASPSNP